MLTYTKRNINVITFILTVIAFFSFHFALNSLVSDVSKLQSKNINTPLRTEGSNVYSKMIPLTDIAKETYKEKTLVPLKEFDILKASYQTNIAKKVQSKKEEEEKLAKLAKIEGTEKLASSSNIENEGNIENLGKLEINSTIENVITNENVQNNEKQGNQAQSQNQTTAGKTQNNKTEKEPNTAREAIKTYAKSTWRVEIPRLNLDVHILEGTGSNILLKAVGHFEDMSTWNGNVGLAAHNRGYRCNFFQNIKKLKKGDEIIYHTSKGKRIYKVETNKVIEETDWTYLKETKDNRITLITCEENRRTCRRCVQAVEVK